MTRLRFDFRLDTQKPNERGLVKLINELKGERAYVSAIRDGLRLIVDLRAGRTDVLTELFPWIVERLAARPASGGGGNLEKQIADLKHVIMQQGIIPAPPAQYPVMKPAGGTVGGFQLLGAPVTDDDDQDTLILKRSESTEAGKNFLGALSSFR